MSPILVRPVREQLEHDRVIRLLQARYRKKFEVGINPGPSLAAPVGPAMAAVYPDVVLQALERSRKLLGVIEVETGESVNHLEAMSQWAAFARLKVPFLLYVPAGSIDTARRLSADYQIPIAELWTYHTVGEEIRFTLVQRTQAALTPKSEITRPTPVVAASKVPVAQAVRPQAPRPTPVPVKVVAKAARPSAKAGKPGKAARPAPPSKSVRTVKSAKPSKSAASTKSAKTVKAVKAVKAVKSAKPAPKGKTAAKPAARKAAPAARRPAKSR